MTPEEQALAVAVLEERRACAKVARDEVSDLIGPARETGLAIAATIEARS